MYSNQIRTKREIKQLIAAIREVNKSLPLTNAYGHWNLYYRAEAEKYAQALERFLETGESPRNREVKWWLEFDSRASIGDFLCG